MVSKAIQIKFETIFFLGKLYNLFDLDFRNFENLGFFLKKERKERAKVLDENTKMRYTIEKIIVGEKRWNMRK